MKTRFVLLAFALLAFASASASAVTPSTTEYNQKTQAMIIGTLVSLDDRQSVVLDTDSGQRVTLLMDSRTMLPVDHAPGTMMRVQFKVLDNGQYYAERLVPMDYAAEHEVSYRDTDEGQLVEARNSSYESNKASEAEDEAPVVEEPASTGTLPQTASQQPLIALLGFASLGAAAILSRVRRAGRRLP